MLRMNTFKAEPGGGVIAPDGSFLDITEEPHNHA
jgi:hypothetical protein